jgi:type IV pilus secretin PilQ/predicted competence protein
MKMKPVIRWLGVCLLLAVICALTGRRVASRHLTARIRSARTLPAPLAILPLSPQNADAFDPAAGLPATPRADARITQISIQADQQGTEFVKIGTTRPVQIKPLRLSHPARLVVDLQPVQVRQFRRILADREGVLKDVRLAQFQNTPTAVARVVADLSQNAPFRIESEPDGIRIQFREPEKSVESPRQALNASPAIPTAQHEDAIVRALEKPVKLNLTSFRLRQDKSPQRLDSANTGRPGGVFYSEPKYRDSSLRGVYAERSRGASLSMTGDETQTTGKGFGATPSRKALQQPGGNTLLAQVEPQKRQAVADPTPAARPAPAWASDRVPEAALPSLTELQQVLQAVQIDADSSPGLGAFENRGTGILSTPFSRQHRFTGKLISLDLRDVDIRDFFRLIHQISGLNIVVDSNVTGRITMVMDDVPWDQALSIALKDNGLTTDLEGNVLRIAKVSTLVDEAKAEADERTAKLEAEPLVTVVRQLRYAHAADQQPMQATSIGGAGGGGMGGSTNQLPIPGVVTMLTSMKGVLSPDGKAVADPRDNAVIITDHRSQIPVIESVIDKLDAKAQQVSIQVRVILANADFTRTLSSVLSASYRNPSGSTQTAAGTGQNITGVAAPGPPLPSLGALTQPSSVAANGFGAFAVTNAGARYAINAAITAAETRDQARTISRPTIVTQNNVQGEVQQGVQIPIQTNINNTIAVQYVNATLQLTVTPQVTLDNKVFLNIYVNNASVGSFSTFVGPSINTQQATTQVLVPDGGTVVFGGITVTTRARSATYVPLLGSIPIIGNLFKSSSVNDQNQELLFFVSPTILPG